MARIQLSSNALSLIDKIYDNEFYLKAYPDVAKAGIDGKTHFITQGIYENRTPNAIIDPKFISNLYKDFDSYKTELLKTVALAQIEETFNPVLHFVTQGVYENRLPSAFLDSSYLLANNQDIADGVKKAQADYPNDKAAQETAHNPVLAFFNNPGNYFSSQAAQDANQKGLSYAKAQYASTDNPALDPNLETSDGVHPDFPSDDTDVIKKFTKDSNDNVKLNGTVTANQDTYQEGDKYVGTAKSALALTANNADLGAVTGKGVPFVYVTAKSSILGEARSYDMANIEDVKEVFSDKSNAPLVVDNVVNNLPTFGLIATGADTTRNVDLTINTEDSAYGSDTKVDSLKLVVANKVGAKGNANNPTVTVNNSGDNRLSTVNINSTYGKNTNIKANNINNYLKSIAGTALATDYKLNITGNTALTITDSIAANSVDASANLAGVSVKLANAKQLTFVGGKGDDSVSLVKALDAKTSIDGKEGNNTINIANGANLTAASGAQILNFQTLDLAGAQGSFDLSLLKAKTDASTIKHLVINDDLANSVVVNNMLAGGDLVINASTTRSLDVNQLTVTQNARGSNDAVSMNVTINNSGTATTVKSLSEGVNNLTDLTVSTIKSTKDANNTIGSINFNNLKNLTITGDAGLKITHLVSNSKLARIDASGLTGDNGFDLISSLATSGTFKVIGSKNTDSFNFSSMTGNAALNIIGDSGADTIKFGTAHAGINKVVYETANDGGVSKDQPLSADSGKKISNFIDNLDKISISGPLADAVKKGAGGQNISALLDNTAHLAAPTDPTKPAIITNLSSYGIISATAAGGVLATQTGAADIKNVTDALGIISGELKGQTKVIMLNDDTGNNAAVYAYQANNDDNRITADEVQLLGYLSDTQSAASTAGALTHVDIEFYTSY